jgi:hypothetical protein
VRVEKAIAAALEPVIELVLAAEARIDEIDKRPAAKGERGDDGKDADPEQVAAILADKYFEVLRGPSGRDGENGAAGATPTAEAVAEALLARFPEALRGEKGRSGRDGRDADPEAVAAILASKFLHVLRGPAGKSGKNGKDGLDGSDGKDADAEQVAEVLLTKYADRLRGQKGDKGDKGERGEDGAPADVEQVAAVLAEKHAELLRGAKGDAGDDGKRGPPGDKGSDGKDGADGVGITVKSWSPGVYRKGEIVQHDIGRYSVALKDTASIPGASEEWERIGTSGFKYCGIKKSGVAYEVGDIYIDDGTTFMWTGEKARMLAKRGEKGAKGDKGDKGDAGRDGDAAPDIIDISVEIDRFIFVKSNGEVVEAKADWFFELASKMSETILKFESRIEMLDELIEERAKERA